MMFLYGYPARSGALIGPLYGNAPPKELFFSFPNYTWGSFLPLDRIVIHSMFGIFNRAVFTSPHFEVITTC